jgi:hypothetical protein
VKLLHSKTPGGVDSTPKLQAQIEVFGYQLHSILHVPPVSLIFFFILPNLIFFFTGSPSPIHSMTTNAVKGAGGGILGSVGAGVVAIGRGAVAGGRGGRWVGE